MKRTVYTTERLLPNKINCMHFFKTTLTLSRFRSTYPSTLLCPFLLLFLFSVTNLRERGSRWSTEDEEQEGSNHVHRRATASFAGQLQPGLEPRWPGLGAHRSDHGPQQTGDTGVVPKFAGPTEEASERDGQRAHGRSRRQTNQW